MKKILLILMLVLTMSQAEPVHCMQLGEGMKVCYNDYGGCIIYDSITIFIDYNYLVLRLMATTIILFMVYLKFRRSNRY